MIKSLKRFLAGAAIVSSSVTAHAHPGDLTLEQMDFQADRTEVNALHTKSISGKSIHLHMPKELDTKTFHNGNLGNSGHYHVMNSYRGQMLCSIVLDMEALKTHHVSVDSNLHTLVDRNAYLFSVVAHEVSHCLGVSDEEQEDLIKRILEQPDMQTYEAQAVALASSISEVHADLTAALLGASKTGDWAVLDNYLIPERSKGFNPHGTTLLAVYDLMREINPKSLEGKSFAEIMQISNTVFSLHTYQEGTLNPTSTVVSRILQEWNASSLEVMAYLASTPGVGNVDDPEWRKNANTYDRFAEQLIGADSYRNRNAAVGYYALKAYGIDQQTEILPAVNFMDTSIPGAIRAMHTAKLGNMLAALTLYDKTLIGESISVGQFKRTIEGIIDKHKNWNASHQLGTALGSLIHEAINPETLPNGQDAIAQQRIREQSASAYEKGVTSKGVDNKGFHLVYSDDGKGNFNMGSGIQWNAHFFVTAEHVVVPGTTCKQKCDLKFVRKDASGVLPKWRDGVPGESVWLVGAQPQEGGVVERPGRILAERVTVGGDVIRYGLVEGLVREGMSGGPVYASDGKVVGMMVAYLNKSTQGEMFKRHNVKDIGIFVPTSEIEKHWKDLKLDRTIENTLIRIEP